MLAPVLIVVFVTMVINVLKIFDIIINLGANTSEPGGQASTLASDVYYKGFPTASIRVCPALSPSYCSYW